MEKFDPRVDAYIDKAADFAKPILTHIRMLVHQACPEVTETIKWGFPNFDYKGIVCNMAAFKAHCSFGFWKSKLLPDPHQLLGGNTTEAMGQLGKLTTVSDLPADAIFITYVQNAVILNKEGTKVQKKAVVKGALEIPDDFNAALDENPAAKVYFEKLSISQKREYVDWITEAKTVVTREKRMATAMTWLAEEKQRNWKYM